MNSKVAQYLPTSGKGHGILYVKQCTKQTRLFHPNSATKQLEKPEDKNKPENLTESATDGRTNAAKGPQVEILEIVLETFLPTVDQATNLRSFVGTEYTADEPSQIQVGNTSLEYSTYEDGLKCLPYYICEKLIGVWIDLLQPEKTKLLIALLDGKLQEVATAQELTTAAEHSGSLSYLGMHQHTLEGVLQRYEKPRKQPREEPMNWLQIVLRDDIFQPMHKRQCHCD
ncbi:hypothetical protein N7541_009391 [Penicillium brevicompactum]|uniref:Uncharacterized protein n=1 Tax=Penicillium brevicompactum TaxID=5074 RepID=A0A9W9UGN0_PENBR|nr:hypothetical protein N7541_009391 [Penicillium brevicompactum]